MKFQIARLAIKTAQLVMGPETKEIDLELVMKEDEDVVPLLQEALMAEFQQWDLYYAYKALLMGLSRDPIADHFADHAGDEADHIDLLQRYIVGMGHRPTVKRLPIPNLESLEIEQIIALQLKFEKEAVKTYQQILQVLDSRPSSALKIDIENLLAKEVEHAHDLQLLLRKE